ncbi:TPA: glycosyltransferase family 4 protein [Enterobacter hormaechei subsp. steigerwaltii]|nr:glycosyltransferase family 4 protein [Enterobacter hormaechei subsp. steigerwaltii]HED2280966.1 glycosyltransferase family 4 protein [Enterobacter hormaechei subsp. steigerwaltii]HED3382999.1 glycosyltransferase family 4 protein [Enterobacter hormaechei subsp. steigerwaltii]HED3420220.1 glycosyltransferase family 4 protein [Enterobacter hormaechei subsp. steigerwaltii]
MNKKESYIIISAHHCCPDLGSEHAVGWNYVRELSAFNKILLITQDNQFKERITEEVERLNSLGRDIQVFFVSHGSSANGKNNSLRIGYYFTYIIYQIKVFKIAKKLIKNFDVKLTHHLNIVGFREPGFLWLLDIPFVWGPVGGLVYTPRAYFSLFPRKYKLFQYIREFLTKIQFSFSPRVYFAYKKSMQTKSFISASPDIGNRFKNKFGGDFNWVTETASNVNVTEPIIESNLGAGRKLNLLWVGALIERKPLTMLLEALSRINNVSDRIHLNVIGDGDSRQKYENYSLERNLDVTFNGWIDYQNVNRCYESADVVVMLSVNGNDSNLLIVFYVQIMPDDFVMQLHRF